MRLPEMIFSREMKSGDFYLPNPPIKDEVKDRTLVRVFATETATVKIYYHPWIGLKVINGLGAWITETAFYWE